MSALPATGSGGERPFLAGLVEGFYGRPWRDADRRAYARLLPQLGLNSYLYCPKADPFLRRQWQRHWPRPRWRALLDLAACYRRAGLYFGVGLSPFALYRRYGDAERRQLREKVSRLAELQGGLLALLFDDMPGDVPDLAERQAEIVADVRAWSPQARLLMCPTYYSRDPVLEKHFGAMPPDYWERLGELLPVEVDVFWTGNRVCAERIAAADLAPLARAFGRPLTLWDNYPVNDGALRSKYLYLDPLPEREPGLGGCLAGHFCNPMNQAWLSLPALRGLAELHTGAQLPAGWEAQQLGAPLWACLQRDRELFQRAGLDGLAPDRREALAAEYDALSCPAGAEVAAWLRGEFAFDPACLTD